MADTTAVRDELHGIPTADSLSQFERVPLKKSRTWFTPDVILLTGPSGERCVLKDFSGCPVIARKVWCRKALARETIAYEKLASLEGVPQLLSRLSPDAFIMSFIEGRPLPRRKAADMIPAGFFERLVERIDQMHQLGVAHGDMRRKNMLIGPDGKPRLIDFETALTDSSNPVKHRVFETIARIDRITVVKIKARYFPDGLTAEEEQILAAAPLHLRAGRFFRRHVYGLLSPKQLRRRFKKKSDS